MNTWYDLMMKNLNDGRDNKSFTFLANPQDYSALRNSLIPFSNEDNRSLEAIPSGYDGGYVGEYRGVSIYTSKMVSPGSIYLMDKWEFESQYRKILELMNTHFETRLTREFYEMPGYLVKKPKSVTTIPVIIQLDNIEFRLIYQKEIFRKIARWIMRMLRWHVK